MRTAIVATVVCSSALLACQTFAHHSVAMFDQQQEIAIDGVVKELELVNPHSWLHITVTKPYQMRRHAFRTGAHVSKHTG